jgi:hypothetical protein
MRRIVYEPDERESATSTAGSRIVIDHIRKSRSGRPPVHDRPETRIHDVTGIQAPSTPSIVCAARRALHSLRRGRAGVLLAAESMTPALAGPFPAGRA